MFVLIFFRTDVLLTRISMFKMSLTSKCFVSLRSVFNVATCSHRFKDLTQMFK